MRSLLLIDRPSASETAPGRQANPAVRKLMPDYILQSHGYEVKVLGRNEPLDSGTVGIDAIILNLPLNEGKSWTIKLRGRKHVPFMWWCSERTATLSNSFCEDDIAVDGILTPNMSEQELHWALHIGAKQSMERHQWMNERKQLEARLEERKWIDMAKGILCKIKNVSEAEAYELLRKQAMNERKRMVDVATSIVKVYQILQDQK